MKRIITALFLLVLVPLSAHAGISLFGYSGVADSNGSKLYQINNANIRINVGTVDFPENWQITPLKTITTEFSAQGIKTGLFLDNVLFGKIYTSSSQCSDGGGPFYTALRSNWQDRLNSFATTNVNQINTSKTAFLSVATEVNNTCTPLDQVQTAATAVKAKFPGVPIVMGYGRSPGAKPAPAYIPTAVDWVGFYKYGIFDPNNAANPYNADNQYLVEYNSLVSKLAMHQRILLVPDGFWGSFLHAALPSATGTGWPKGYLSPLALNYETFAMAQSRVVGLLFFVWSKPNDPNFLGTKELPSTVRDTHRQIACRRIGC